MFYIRSLLKTKPKSGLTEMKKIFNPEYYFTNEKMMAAAKHFVLRGTSFTMDTHSILFSFSTPFFPRR